VATVTKYRADIDGLRAIAVIPVLLYHVGVPGFSGGFVGVDIFFVISGYLICGMIAADLRDGSFSLVNFYKRRILRILPALFVMFLATSVLAAIYCLPVELVDYVRSLASAVASVSNVHFAQVAGYFDPPAETRPLLHTWSLSVEEQFYFAVPLVMLLVYRFMPKRVGLLFAVVATISFAGALAMSARNPTFAFYLTPFRAWELALGAMLSVEFLPVPETAFWRNASGASGLLLLAGVIAFGSSATPLLAMTGLAAAGATLVIASSVRTVSVAGRLLSLPPLVFVGLISYSLYLWHWPLIVFQRTDAIFLTEFSASAKLILITLAFGLAYLSWKLVETPFRNLAKRTSKPAIFGATAAAMASTVGLCGMVILFSGAPFRFPPRVVEIGSFLAYDSSAAVRTGRCFLSTNRQRLDAETCLKLDPSRPNYLLLGDSHAAHLWSGLSQAMPEFNIMQATASLCRPAATAGSRYDTPACRAMMEFVFGGFLAHTRVDGVLLAASWKDEDLPFLSATLQFLKSKGIDATVLGPIVEYDAALPRLLVDGILHDTPAHASTKRTPGIRERDLAMKRMVTAAGATYLSVYDAMCRDDLCDEFVRGDIPMQFDAGHLTAEGAAEVGRRLSIAFVRKHARAGDVSN
jgi:peptidoglycan/LPS O-acetylase OafA/YrhL